MENTVNLTLPYIMPSQAQKHVTHNEALRMLDALVQLSAHDRNRTAPPAAPADGDRHIVADAATGAWQGRDGQIAAWQDGGWAFFRPAAGWLAWVVEEETLLAFHDGRWQAAGGPLQNLEAVGVNAAADAVNRLAVASAAVLFSHDGEGHQLKINKAAAETASLLFQTGFSGRAEMGTAGDDNFRFKVSGDGTSWHDAIVIDKDTGAVSFPGTALAGGREVLGAGRTYHVRADGDDGNDGLTDSAAGAFATIQRAIDEVASLDLAVHDATIQIGHGTWTQPLVLKSLTGSGRAILRGDPATPANVTLAVNAGSGGGAIHANGVNGIWRLQGLLVTTGAGRGLIAENYSVVEIAHMAFGVTHQEHIRILNGAAVVAVADYQIVGGASRHIFADFGGLTDIRGVGDTAVTVTVSGTPHFSTAFVQAAKLSMVRVDATWSGAATGMRYSVNTNAMISAGGPEKLPGSTDGTATDGGIYL